MDTFFYISFLIVKCFITFITILCLGLYIYLLYLKWIFRHIPGPNPGWHFLSTIRKLRECTIRGEYYHFQFLRWTEEYGLLYKVFFFHKVMLICTDALTAKGILTDSRYKKSKVIYTRVSMACGKRFLGGGLVTNYKHEKWKQRRSCLNPAFKKRYLQGVISQFNMVANRWVDKLKLLADGKTQVNMAEMLARVTVDTIAKVAFNIDLEADDSKFLDSLNKILDGMSIANKDPFMNYRWIYAKKIKEVHEAVDYIRNLAREEINRRRRSSVGTPLSKNDDIISLLLKSKECIPELTIEDLVDDVVTVFVAGQETTASALAFLFTELGRNDDIRSRLETEIQNVIGDKTFVTNEHINQLQYTTQVIKETLRLYPPAPATVRDIPASTNVAQYTIPVDSIIIFPFFVIHRIPQYYRNPANFDPDRWAPDQPRPKYSYMPFSLGQRSCAGQQFAMIEFKILLCKVLQTFNFTLDLEQSFDIQEVTTLKVKGGAQMILTLK